MVTGRRPRVPRALLIYCEGKTEEAYFNILTDYYRPPAHVAVRVYGQKGQHKALVDNAVAKRAELSAELDISEDDIECWAVCDEDQMPYGYTDLKRYAGENGARLAFSAPQFEMYLIQHFEQSGETDKSEVFRRLSEYRKRFGGEGDYDDGTKADLGWMDVAIDHRPKIVRTAITNSEMRDRTTRRPFLTVHELTKRILELAI